MKRPLLIGGGLLALYYLLGSEKTYAGGFKYDIGGAARSIVAGQVAIGFHPCGLGWAIQRTSEGKYTVRLWSLAGNDFVPSGGGLKPLRINPGGTGPSMLSDYIAPGQEAYRPDLPIFEFDDVVSAGNSISAAAYALTVESGAPKEDWERCIETPAVARKGKVNATGVTTLQNWLQAGGEDLQA